MEKLLILHIDDREILTIHWSWAPILKLMKAVKNVLGTLKFYKLCK